MGAEGNGDLARHNQKLEFLLRGDDRFQVSRSARALQFADITLKSGATLVRDEVIPIDAPGERAGQCGSEQFRS